MKCIICSAGFEGQGHSPEPIGVIDDSGGKVPDQHRRCCDECNWRVVLPERMKDRRAEETQVWRSRMRSLLE